MLFLIIFLCIGIVLGSEEVSVCLPTEIIKWERYEFEQHVQECLVTNFKWKATNSSVIQPYVLAYLEAYSNVVNVEEKDNDLFYKRRTLMAALRDAKLKVTHHIHAMKKCAETAVSVNLMDAYSNEAQMMTAVMKLWTHNIKQDFNQCKRVLLDMVRRKHYHLQAHIFNANKEYKLSLKAAADARELAELSASFAEKKREELFSMLTIQI